MARILYTDMAGNEQSIGIHDGYAKVTVGRAVDCDIRSNRKSVSRHHAEIVYLNGQFEVIDLNSSNGTFLMINDQRRPIIGREYITHNDEIWCGDFILHFLDDPLKNSGINYGGQENQRAPVPTFQSSPPAAGNWSPASPTYPPEAPELRDPMTERNELEPLTAEVEELERLMAEKSSIEELATRQAHEIERLERLLHENESQPEIDVDEVEALQKEIAKLELENSVLLEKIQSQRDDNSVSRAEEKIEKLRALNDDLRNDIEEAREKITEIDSLKDELAAKSAELEVVIDQSNDDENKIVALEETASTLRLEIERLSNQLVDCDLQTDAEIHGEMEKLAERALGFERDLKTNESELLLLRSEFRNEEEEKKSLAKQLVSVRKEKEKIQDQLQEVKRSRKSRKSGAESSMSSEVREFLTGLERLIDAIERTDLMPLSTVDRVRLQSAIRELNPKETLRAFLEKNK